MSRVRHGTLLSAHVSRWIPGCGSDENVIVGPAAAVPQTSRMTMADRTGRDDTRATPDVN
jgi:hypothetical protein